MASRKTKKAQQGQWRRQAVSMVGLLLVALIGFQLVGGDRGLLSYYAMQQEKQEALKSLELVTEERMKLELRVRRMRPESLDKDLLEEQAKATLGYIRPDERVLIVE